jgi:hypothetical protein
MTSSEYRLSKKTVEYEGVRERDKIMVFKIFFSLVKPRTVKKNEKRAEFFPPFHRSNAIFRDLPPLFRRHQHKQILCKLCFKTHVTIGKCCLPLCSPVLFTCLHIAATPKSKAKRQVAAGFARL